MEMSTISDTGVAIDLAELDPQDLGGHIHDAIEQARGTGERAPMNNWQLLANGRTGPYEDPVAYCGDNIPDRFEFEDSDCLIAEIDKIKKIFKDDEDIYVLQIDGHTEWVEEDGGTMPATHWWIDIYRDITKQGPTRRRCMYSLREFVNELDQVGELIDPEQAFRDLCNEQDSGLPHDPRYGPEMCRLECRDEPAFRQGLNDHADAMQKGNEWATFDNGESYYTAEAIKEALLEFDAESHMYAKELREVIDFWI